MSGERSMNDGIIKAGDSAHRPRYEEDATSFDAASLTLVACDRHPSRSNYQPAGMVGGFRRSKWPSFEGVNICLRLRMRR